MISGDSTWTVVCSILAASCLKTDARMFVYILCATLLFLMLEEPQVRQSGISARKGETEPNPHYEGSGSDEAESAPPVTEPSTESSTEPRTHPTAPVATSPLVARSSGNWREIVGKVVPIDGVFHPSVRPSHGHVKRPTHTSRRALYDAFLKDAEASGFRP